MDPACGRFVSEDPARDGVNWFAYTDNNPINNVDRDGQRKEFFAVLVGTGLGFAFMAVFMAWANGPVLHAIWMADMAVLLFSAALMGATSDWLEKSLFWGTALLFSGRGVVFQGMIKLSLEAAEAGNYTMMQAMTLYVFAYGMEVMGALIAAEYAFETGS
jgi:hypothetical protein